MNENTKRLIEKLQNGTNATTEIRELHGDELSDFAIECYYLLGEISSTQAKEYTEREEIQDQYDKHQKAFFRVFCRDLVSNLKEYRDWGKDD